jgi:hypothetical protein
MGVQAGTGKPLASSPLLRLTVQALHFKGNAFDKAFVLQALGQLSESHEQETSAIERAGFEYAVGHFAVPYC